MREEIAREERGEPKSECEKGGGGLLRAGERERAMEEIAKERETRRECDEKDLLSQRDEEKAPGPLHSQFSDNFFLAILFIVPRLYFGQDELSFRPDAAADQRTLRMRWRACWCEDGRRQQSQSCEIELFPFIRV